MAIYSYYYSTDPGGNLQQSIQSQELKMLGVLPMLNKLAGLHALVPGGQTEMMSYLLEQKGCSIIGLSYTEKQNVSGNMKNMNCSLQYVASGNELAAASAELSKVVNFISFQKPPASSPAPLSSWPLLDSGYWYHNSTATLTPLVDGLARVAMSPGEKVLLIGLPKAKKNGYAFARYTMAELLGFLPEPVRPNIRFFTGLPVTNGVTDPGTGFDNAVQCGANVVFCPHDYFGLLRQYRQCISVDMDLPSAEFGAFADYITHVPDVPVCLAAIDSCLSGQVTYDSLNRAAETVRNEGVSSIGELRRQLDRSHQNGKNLEQEINRQDEEYNQLCDDYEELQEKNKQLQEENRNLQAEMDQMAQSGTTVEELRKDMQLRQDKIQEMGRKMKAREQAYQQLQREYNALLAQQLNPGEKPAGDGNGEKGEAQDGKLLKAEKLLREAEQKQQETERKLQEREKEYRKLLDAHDVLRNARDELLDEKKPDALDRAKRVLLAVLFFLFGFLACELMRLIQL